MNEALYRDIEYRLRIQRKRVEHLRALHVRHYDNSDRADEIESELKAAEIDAGLLQGRLSEVAALRTS